ncbi:hypothetical protein RI129_000541 [Pyrocoelia pectoralis]|uniref:Uncharacterized protein n=1 Tax=Pyrocoelia pectoralis TaxID=417401 RepID=A0AAN7VJB3_9COLE
MVIKFAVWAALITLAQVARVPGSTTHLERENGYNPRIHHPCNYNTEETSTEDYEMQGKSRDDDVGLKSAQFNVTEHVADFKPNLINHAVVANAHISRAEEIRTPVIPISIPHDFSPIAYQNYEHPEYVGYSPYVYSTYKAYPTPYDSRYGQQVYY